MFVCLGRVTELARSGAQSMGFWQGKVQKFAILFFIFTGRKIQAAQKQKSSERITCDQWYLTTVRLLSFEKKIAEKTS